MKNKLTSGCRGFTLVELLVVIGILGTISSMFIYAYRAAKVESQNQKSRSTVEKISDVLNARMLEYENYPVPLAIPSNSIQRPGVRTKQELVDRARLLMLREIIRTEMPDHPDDLKATYYWFDRLNTTNPPVVRMVQTGLIDPLTNDPVFIPPTPVMASSITSRALRIFGTLANQVAGLQPPPFTLNNRPWDAQNANAELLFLIVADSEFDGASAMELFDQTEIADTDRDGLSEFIDGFGTPIKWIRWPTGYQIGGKNFPDMLNPSIVNQLTGTVSIDSEPYDRLRADPGWSASIVGLQPGVFPPPLVLSAGPDGFFGLNFREVDRYTSGAPAPRWPILAPTSYSASDLPFPQLPSGVLPGPPYIFCDPWSPRTETSMRMGSFLQAPAGPNAPFDPTLHDPKEGGPNAPWTNPRTVADDNITNFDGSASSL